MPPLGTRKSSARGPWRHGDLQQKLQWSWLLCWKNMPPLGTRKNSVIGLWHSASPRACWPIGKTTGAFESPPRRTVTWCRNNWRHVLPVSNDIKSGKGCAFGRSCLTTRGARQESSAQRKSTTVATSSVLIVSPESDIQSGLAGHLAECGLTIIFASTVDGTRERSLRLPAKRCARRLKT
jgi:hypothetical protein